MAIVDDGFDLYISLVDAGGDVSTVSYALTAATHADALTAAGTILTRLEAVTKAVVKGYSIVNRYVENDLTLPIADVQVENRAKVVSRIADSPLKTAVFYIPAPEDAIFLGGPGSPAYNIVDTLDAALLLYSSIWIETADDLATISDGEYLETAGLLRGERTHRRASHG